MASGTPARRGFIVHPTHFARHTPFLVLSHRLPERWGHRAATVEGPIQKGGASAEVKGLGRQMEVGGLRARDSALDVAHLAPFAGG